MQQDAGQPLRGESDHQSHHQQRDRPHPSTESEHEHRGESHSGGRGHGDARPGKDGQEGDGGRAGEGGCGDRQRHTELTSGQQPERPCIGDRIAEERLHQYAAHSQGRTRDDGSDHPWKPDVEHDLPGQVVDAATGKSGQRLSQGQGDLPESQGVEAEHEQRDEQDAIA